MNFDKINLVEYFLKNGKKIKFRKKEYFSKQNEFTESIGLVLKGSFKLFYKKGKKEWIKSFIFENGIIGNLPSLFEKTPNTYSIMSIEKSEIIVLNGNKLIKESETNIQFLKQINQFFIKLYLKKEKRVSDFLLLNPEERYKKFISEYQINLSRISQIDQAAYLGITNVALSRIKSRVFEDKNELLPNKIL